MSLRDFALSKPLHGLVVLLFRVLEHRQNLLIEKRCILSKFDFCSLGEAKEVSVWREVVEKPPRHEVFWEK